MAMVMRSATFAAPADEVWAVIGDFNALSTWHPAVERQTAEGDRRNLDLGGGNALVERLLGQDGMSYSYEIVSGPLPVEDYRSTISATPAGSGCVVVWTSTFEPKADNASGVVAGIYEAGFAALGERFPAGK